MNPFRSITRRRKPELSAERLETRELLTGGHNTFAIIPGNVAKTDGTAAIAFTVDSTHFTLPRKSFALGIDVVPDASSSIKPLISSVNNPHGDLVPQTFHSIYNPHLSHLKVASGAGTSAVITPISLYPHQPDRPATYSANVDALGKTSGNFLLGFYLPGDANGDGVVNKADLQIVKSDLGARSNQTKYNFDADANRDGRIGLIDVSYVQQNMGVSTNISPIVQANYDNSNDVGALSSRVSKGSTAHFSGTATPGASISYTEVANQVPSTSTTADASGNYSIIVPLANGTNTFRVMSQDGFGQVIQGTIAPVSYISPAQTAAAAALTSGAT
jgi:hypothetical protein